MNKQLFLPPEWAPQSMVQLTWPHADTDWHDCLSAIDDTYTVMADAITRYEPLLIVTPEAERVKALLSARLPLCQLEKIRFHYCETNDTWTRDHGFITMLDSDGRPTLLDFRFNGWGDKFPSELDNSINRSLFDGKAVTGTYENHLDFVLEGGSIESDGHGTVLTTSQCLLAPNRNQPLTQTEIEERLKVCLRAERILWLDHGNLQGDDTDGHVDTIARFAPHDTILYTACDNPSDPQYADLHVMEEQLRGFKTNDGRPYRLLRLPLPEPVIYAGERLPATYANFLVINGAVLLPTYNQADRDQEAARVVKEAFPNRDILPIDSTVIVRQHGSIHCCTMQFPMGNKNQ